MSIFCPVQINFPGGNEKLKAIKMRCGVYMVLNHSHCENLVFTSWQYYRYGANFCFYYEVQGRVGAVRSCRMTSSKSQATELYLFVLLSPVICL